MPRVIRRNRLRHYRQDQAFGRPFRLNKHSPQAKGLVGWWPFLGSRHSFPIRDFSGRHNDLAQTNLPTWIRDGDFGSVLLFDDASTEKLTSTIVPVTAYPYTFVCWFLSDDVTINAVLVAFGSSTDDNEYTRIFINDAAGDSLSTHTKSAGINIRYNTTATVTANKFFHGAGVFTSATDQIAYLNGDSAGSYDLEVNPNFPAVDRLGVGVLERATPSAFLSGCLAACRIYNRALTASEVYQLYAPQTRWDLYEPIPRVFPAFVPAAGERVMELLFGGRKVLAPRSRL